jgi:glycosyltransferase involved in cell wall biosynthesis
MKLACVVQRFGVDIAGGSERHCRFVAEHLASTHQVTVLTSCAKDYVTWHNVYPPGVSTSGPLRVERFAVARPRRLHRFAEISEVVFSGRSSLAEQESWFEENGPDVPGLLRHLQDHGREYDRVLFWTYRYAPSFFGVPLVADRAILVPTAEEDPLIRADILGRFFTLPAGYLFLTPEEADLVATRASGALPTSAVIGCGVDAAPSAARAVDLASFGIANPFVLYLGRIERNKGCETLLGYFDHYLAHSGRPVQLVMAGPANMPIPDHSLIKWLGAVSDQVREALLSQAELLVVPSPFESLSMVLLEAWNHRLPALVNGRCGVLKGQVLRADGGLYYRHANEFAAGLAYLLDHPVVAERLGEQGLAYVEREYRWPHVMRKVETLLGQTVAPRANVPAAV